MLPWGVKSPDNLSLGICKALRQLIIINDKCSSCYWCITNHIKLSFIHSRSFYGSGVWTGQSENSLSLPVTSVASSRRPDSWLRAGIIVSYLHSLMLMLAVGWDHNWTVGQNFNLTCLHVGWFGLPHSMAAELYEWAIQEDRGEARGIFMK